MSNHQTPAVPGSVGRTSQIICGVLIMGVVSFGVVAFLIGKAGQPKLPVISMGAAGFGLMAVVMRFVVPMVVVNGMKAGLKQTASEDLLNQLAGVYQTKTIIAFALLEGAAFANLVAYLFEGQMWSYGVVAFLLGVMAISFPSQGQFESWAEDMKRELN